MSEPSSGEAPARPVYSKVDEVVIPQGVSPGERFVVDFWVTKNGQRVVGKKELFRAAGVAPQIFQRSIQVAQGDRRAQRPSAQARARTGSAHARAIDNLQSKPFQPPSWSTSQELPFEANAADVPECRRALG